MAGQARKKAQKAANITGSFYWKVIIVVNLLYVACLAYHIKNNTKFWVEMQQWSVKKKIAFPFLTFCCYALAYHGLVSAAVERLSASTYVDLLGLTMAAQFTSFVTHWFWVLFLVLPVAGVYLYVLPLFGMLKGLMGGGGGEGGTGGEDEKKEKKKRK
ncbi:hypothetical protein VYU27_004641 [Nannochloropsis oceanica]